MALISISGVLLDGTGTAIPTRQDINVYAQDTAISVTVKGQNGTVINLTGYSALMTIKAGPVPAPAATLILVGTLTSPTLGIVTFTMSRASAKGLQYPSYLYDVYITSAGNQSDEVVTTSMMTNNFSVGA